MAEVQAYKRTKTYVHAFDDVTLKFEPNAVGDVVCDVQSQSAVDRLLLTPTGFRLYGVRADEPLSTVLTGSAVVELPPVLGADDHESLTFHPLPGAETPAADSPYVLKDGDNVLDLRGLDDEALHALAKANEIAVHHACKGDTIRDKIVAAFTTSATSE